MLKNECNDFEKLKWKNNIILILRFISKVVITNLNLFERKNFTLETETLFE